MLIYFEGILASSTPILNRQNSAPRGPKRTRGTSIHIALSLLGHQCFPHHSARGDELGIALFADGSKTSSHATWRAIQPLKAGPGAGYGRFSIKGQDGKPLFYQAWTCGTNLPCLRPHRFWSCSSSPRGEFGEALPAYVSY